MFILKLVLDTLLTLAWMNVVSRNIFSVCICRLSTVSYIMLKTFNTNLVFRVSDTFKFISPYVHILQEVDAEFHMNSHVACIQRSSYRNQYIFYF